jgi:hypothetical protein
MAVATEDYAAWLDQADIPSQRRTPQLDVLLEAVYRFRQQQGNDYYSTRLLSHFLLHCDCGLKVAQIARLVGIARPTASKQQQMSSKAAIRQAHHRMDGRSHGKLLPRYAGPIAAFLLGHPKASQAELIEFVAQTFGERVSRIALYKFLKKYGLNHVAEPGQPPVPANPAVDVLTDASQESPAAPAPPPDRSTVPPLEAPAAPALPPGIGCAIGRSTVPPLESPTAPPLAPTIAPTPVVLPVGLLGATLIATPTPVIELARAVDPSQPSASPFSTRGRNTPAPSC